MPIVAWYVDCSKYIGVHGAFMVMLIFYNGADLLLAYCPNLSADCSNAAGHVNIGISCSKVNGQIFQYSRHDIGLPIMCILPV
jgi:hypothetical protein